LRNLSRISLFKELADFVSFKTRRRVILAIIVSSVFGTSYWLMPGPVRWWFGLGYTSLILMGIIFQTGLYVSLASSGIELLVFRRRFNPVPYSSPEVNDLGRKMGVRKVKVYSTENPNVKAFTNAFTSRVYISSSWIGSFSKAEILGVLGHEFAHITRLRRFVLEMILALAISYGFAWGLYFFTVLVLSTAFLVLVFDAAYIAMALFLFSFVCWRAEFRSDKESANVTGPQGLISVFERFRHDKDDGFETHPPLSKRIQRLEAMLPNESP